jgi:hypothetical protein
MGGSYSTNSANDDMYSLFKEFLEIYCEIDGKKHCSFTELTSAFYVYLKRNNKQNNIILDSLVDCVVQMLLLAQKDGIDIKKTGFSTVTNPYEFVYVTGVWLKSFPQ